MLLLQNKWKISETLNFAMLSAMEESAPIQLYQFVFM